MTQRRMLDASSVALAALLSFGILTLWITQRWALGIYQAVALAGCLAWAIWFISDSIQLRWSALLIPLVGVPLWGFAQLGFSSTTSRWQTWNSILTWVGNFAIFFLALQLLQEPARRRRFVKGLLYFGGAVSVLATVQMFTSGGKIFWLFPSGYADFVLGPFVYKNQYAAFIETVLPLALYRGMTDRNRFPYWVVAGIMVASVVASASRTGTLLVLIEVLIVPLLAAARGILPLRKAVLMLAGGVVLSAVFTIVVGWNVVWNRFHQTDSHEVRGDMLRSSVRMIQERPGLGFGMGTWPTVYPAYALYDDGLFANQAHNDWAQWAAEGGLPLLGLMAVFALLLVRLAWNSVWGFGLIALLLHSFVDYPMQQRPALAGWFFGIAGALAAGHTAKRLAIRKNADGA